MTQMHVAQMNVGLLWHPLDDPRSAEFADNTGKVNAVAERSPGFVWRCVDEQAALAEEGITLFDGDPCALCTLSVWETPDALEGFVHKTVHGAFLKRRVAWFRPLDDRSYVIWPVAAGHRPGFREGLDRLATLQADGPTDAAYDFKYLRHKMQAEASE
jgi:hypothetical protein